MLFSCKMFPYSSIKSIFVHISVWFSGYDMVPNGNGAKSAGWSNEKGLKGGLFSPDQPSEALRDVVALPQGITPGAKPGSPEPTSGVLVMVTQDKYQKLRSPVTHGKSYKQTPEPAPATPQVKGPKAAPELGLLGPKGNVPMAATSDAQLEDLLPQGKHPEPESVQSLGGRRETLQQSYLTTISQQDIFLKLASGLISFCSHGACGDF